MPTLGLRLSVGVQGLGGGSSVGVIGIVDQNADLGVAIQAAAGGSATGPNACIVATFQMTSAESIDQLAGPGSEVGGGMSIGSVIGLGLAGGADIVIQKEVIGLNLNAGVCIGRPFPFEMDGYGGYAWLLFR